MLAYLLKRLLLALAVLVTVSGIVFTVTNAAVDPAIMIAGPEARPQDVDAIRHDYGLDRPLPARFARWLAAAATGDLGQSYAMHAPVASLIAERLPVTLTLAATGFALALLVAVPLGTVAALRPNSALDILALNLAVVGQAIPSFWFALMLVAVFGVELRWLPTSGADSWQGYVLPSVALSYYVLPALMRLIRSAMIEVLASDYIRTARAKGLATRQILFKHALRNAIIPVTTLGAVQFGFLLGGSVVIESVFALHGIGFLAWQSIGRGDIPVMQALVLMISGAYVVLGFAADIATVKLDPRLRLG